MVPVTIHQDSWHYRMVVDRNSDIGEAVDIRSHAYYWLTWVPVSIVYSAFEAVWRTRIWLLVLGLAALALMIVLPR